ncbi:MFS transporter [Sphingomonas sp. BT-65]|uniref:MFS transporter n=1 Tax=Sphingomonas sp. BT-65 TaxID=2989821 RepID=UPI00223640EC|nr:MFS transporter [Sphingomonas sp. BT-65]MCW4461502.1 MFS transporter [Sphingomonas sp. BT-65]
MRFVQIWNMCLGLFGVQIVWGLQNVNTSRIFQTLGANIDELAILWIAGPAAGLLVQPLIGHLSDRTAGRFGRRRPYIFTGATLAALALFAMPNAQTLWAASLLLWLLTASINVAMEPFRSLVADKLPEERRTSGFAMQVFFIGLGAVFASALPWILTNWFGVSAHAEPGTLPISVRVAYYIGGVCVFLAVGWSVLTTSERPVRIDPDRADAHVIPTAAGAAALMRRGLAWLLGGAGVALAAWLAGGKREIYLLAAMAMIFGLAQLAAVWLRRRGRRSLGMLEIVEDILHMPQLLARLAIVQFFTWFGLFAMWIYATPAVAARHYGTADPTSPAYHEAADWVGILFAGYNGVAAVGAFLLPVVAARIGRRATHAFCLLAGAAALLGFAVIDDPAMLWPSALGLGCAWAAILSIPYAMVASAVPPGKAGVYMGIHNMFLVLPQLVAATVLGPLVGQMFQGQAIAALLLSAVMLALAALCTFAIPRRGAA